MRSRDDIHVALIGESGHRAVHGFDHRFQVGRVFVEVLDRVNARLPAVGMEMARPLVEADPRGGFGVLRVKRQQYDSMYPVPFDSVEGVVGKTH